MAHSGSLSDPAATDPSSINHANVAASSVVGVEGPPSPSKRKLDQTELAGNTESEPAPKRKAGVTPIKAEFLLPPDEVVEGKKIVETDAADDDQAEAAHHVDRSQNERGKKNKKDKKKGGQNKGRSFGTSTDEVTLCQSRAHYPEFSPKECPFGDKCKFEHDLRKYLKDHKREDLTSFGGVCPVWEVKGYCNVGWKCRFVKSHMTERQGEDGRIELVLVEDEERKQKAKSLTNFKQSDSDTVNTIPSEAKSALMKKKFPTPKADAMIQWTEKTTQELQKGEHKDGYNSDIDADTKLDNDDKADNRARYTEMPLLPSEKRRLYFGPETPVLAPLTTQGNQPFRRLCMDLGAQFTYSEMALSLPTVQGQRSEWALFKAHESEVSPPTFTSKSPNIVTDYNQSKDLRFGAQIAANKPWIALKATEVLTTLLPNGFRCIDLNCGCPIDLVYKEGAGSALMDSPGKLEKILRGMNTVSGPVPITVKIRMGTRDNRPTATSLINRLVLGGRESSLLNVPPSGVAAITLHGRSRQQRYTRSADWSYIASCATLIRNLQTSASDATDTIRAPDPRDQPITSRSNASSEPSIPFFLGNGDCYSHTDYNTHISSAGVDTVMIARGALCKPWVFEEITSGQYLDKSASERLGYIEKFVRYGLEAWGSDEMGLGTTRRFLLEWLSFTCRYVPTGILEHLPPKLQDRPPRWKGRNDLETLLSSGDYRDWIKIR